MKKIIKKLRRKNCQLEWKELRFKYIPGIEANPLRYDPITRSIVNIGLFNIGMVIRMTIYKIVCLKLGFYYILNMPLIIIIGRQHAMFLTK
jgi:hypothetical protein